MDAVHEVSADGVGLFRTEFLFANQDELPDEDQQFRSLSQRCQRPWQRPSGDHPAPSTLGADKQARALRGINPGGNPALGLRAIRYCWPESGSPRSAARHSPPATVAAIRLLIPMLAHAAEIRLTWAWSRNRQDPTARVPPTLQRKHRGSAG